MVGPSTIYVGMRKNEAKPVYKELVSESGKSKS
jgi:hypothetical protein